MRKPVLRSNSYAWLSTAYHEAGHAIVVLLLGRMLFMVEVSSPLAGFTLREGVSRRLAQVVRLANQRRRMPPELLRLWRDECWILDAGAVAEAEFNLISEDDLNSGARGDREKKSSLIPKAGESAFVDEYYYRHMNGCHHLITETCRAFFRMSRVSALTRTLAEALLRTRRMGGDEVIDTLLANRAYQTGQRDLYWVPMGDSPFARSEAARTPIQLRLF